jgi:hypothetical protein
MGAEVAPPLTLVTLDRTPFNIITKSVGEAVRRVYPPAVLRLRDQSLVRFERVVVIRTAVPSARSSIVVGCRNSFFMIDRSRPSSTCSGTTRTT